MLSLCYLTELCALSLVSCTAQQGTPVSGPDLALPCSQSSTCPASNALVAVWLLPHPSPQDRQLCAGDFLYSWVCAADAPFDHMVSLLGCQCSSWCSIPPPQLCLILIWFSRDEAVGGPVLWFWSTGVLSDGGTRGSSCRLPTIAVTPLWLHSFIAFKSLPAKRDWDEQSRLHISSISCLFKSLRIHLISPFQPTNKRNISYTEYLDP